MNIINRFILNIKKNYLKFIHSNSIEVSRDILGSVCFVVVVVVRRRRRRMSSLLLHTR